MNKPIITIHMNTAVMFLTSFKYKSIPTSIMEMPVFNQSFFPYALLLFHAPFSLLLQHGRLLIYVLAWDGTILCYHHERYPYKLPHGRSEEHTSELQSRFDLV